MVTVLDDLYPVIKTSRSVGATLRPKSLINLRSSQVTRPKLPPRPHTRPSKPKGLPRLGEKFEFVRDANVRGDTCHVTAVTTPYRLPSLYHIQPADDEPIHQVWSRHGYDNYNSKPVELEILANHLDTCPRVLTQDIRRAHLSAAYPCFNQAVIAPVKSADSPPAAINIDEFPNPADYRLQLSAMENCMTPSPLPTVSRASTRAKSGKSIHWALTQYRNIHVDKKGRSKAQGPFSREFTVRCHAPNNWLRMKFTRSKTVL